MCASIQGALNAKFYSLSLISANPDKFSEPLRIFFLVVDRVILEMENGADQEIAVLGGNSMIYNKIIASNSFVTTI